MTEIPPRLSVKSVVICDDIRKEDNGKNILIGVYAGTVSVAAFPCNFALSAWIRIESTGAGALMLGFRIMGNDDVLFTSDLAIGVHDGDGALALPMIPVKLSEPCKLSIQMRQGDGDWEIIDSAKVVAFR